MTRERTAIRGYQIVGNMNVEHIEKPNMNIIIQDSKQLRFTIKDLVRGLLKGTCLEDFIEPLQDIQLLVVINQRWLSLIKKGGFYYIFNCHTTLKDGTKDPTDKSPAVIFRADLLHATRGEGSWTIFYFK